MNILAIQKEKQSAVEYYRASPLLTMSRTYKCRVDFIPSREIRETALMEYDILFSHRPVTPSEIRSLALAKSHGLKIVLDYDDLIWSIPVSNPAILHFTEDAAFATQEAMRLADLVTCSTPALQAAIKRDWGRDAQVIPNAWDERQRIAKAWNAPKEGKPISIAWRGSDTHAGDLYQARNAFFESNNVKWIFFGMLPWFILKQYGGNLDSFTFQGPTPGFTEYLRTFEKMWPAYVVFPLEDVEFNKCKSNIAWQEATAIGATVIAPAYMPEFANIPCIQYQSHDELNQWLYTISTGETNEQANELWQQSVIMLKEQYNLKTQVARRYMMIDGMLNN